MKKLFLLTLLSLGLTSISYAGPYDDWPDDSICSWLEQKPTHAGYLGEASKRGVLVDDIQAINIDRMIDFKFVKFVMSGNS